MIFDGAAIGAGAIVRDSIVGKGATIAGHHGTARPSGRGHGVVIGDGAYVGPGNELARPAAVAGHALEGTSVRFSSDA